ncbi:MAG: glutamate--tRNA ligase family protein [Verrucomicrobia bacterium]|nr:glutamate--tRNA ligase family protein [Verrucomicrobiota bacterium]
MHTASQHVPPANTDIQYRGRLAPSPTGLMHLGHARTFWTAQQRALSKGGTLILRNEDLDAMRCKSEYFAAILEDLRWFGLQWQEGGDLEGPFGPYSQSERHPLYRAAFEQLLQADFLFPCICSRQDVQRASQAPHTGDDEPIYPGTCRTRRFTPLSVPAAGGKKDLQSTPATTPDHSKNRVNWRFRVPDGETIRFVDGHYGPQQYVAGKDFGDFLVWRHDNVPSYQLAVTVDDNAMRITEVVRGEDLLRSTARQLLLYRALGYRAPDFFHCPLVTDTFGLRLAKRNDALSLRTLRENGETPESLRRAQSIL